jgi:hypothetical protein
MGGGRAKKAVRRQSLEHDLLKVAVHEAGHLIVVKPLGAGHASIALWLNEIWDGDENSVLGQVRHLALGAGAGRVLGVSVLKRLESVAMQFQKWGL